MQANSLILQYEGYIIGKYNTSHIKYQGDAARNKAITELFRYIFEQILCWTPEQIQLHTDGALLKKLKVDQYYEKLPFPPGLTHENDYHYLAHLLYPKEMPFDQKALTARIYEKVAAGELLKFPKGFFTGETGRRALKYCLMQAVKSQLEIESIEELYRFFTQKRKARALLQKNRLLVAFSDNYYHPLQMIHDMLPEDEKSELFYRFYMFTSEFLDTYDALRQKEKRMKKKEGKTDENNV